METILLTDSEKDISLAAEIIRSGGLVAFPTETVYGLGANALDSHAVQRIYAAKGRPADNPMIVHIARASDIGELTSELSGDAVSLIDNFWPGPLTLVVNKRPIVPDVTTGGLNTVAVRMPDNDTALMLIREAKCPIAAPSANLSGKPSPTKLFHVIEDLEGRIDAIIAGGNCRVGIESTVLDITGEVPVILRPGIITEEDIKAVTGSVKLDSSLIVDKLNPSLIARCLEDGNPKSPGMKYTHYAPKAKMMIIEGQRDRVKSEIERVKKINEEIGNHVGVILFEEKAFVEAARDFFAKLREIDSKGVDIILAGALSDINGVGFAVMNRMMKSAGYNIVNV